jgi:hypothetical protein
LRIVFIRITLAVGGEGDSIIVGEPPPPVAQSSKITPPRPDGDEKMPSADHELAAEAPLTSAAPLPLETLQARVAELVRIYVRRRSPELAHRIVRYCRALAQHPSLRDSPDECNAYCRLSQHWRLLAAQCHQAAAT